MDVPSDEPERGNSQSASPNANHDRGPFAASDYHVPPKLLTPKAGSFRNTIPQGWGKTKLPERCQFMFSDGRQCTMARSDIHPSLCVYHSDREEQLFGDPGARCEAKTLDLPELHSACRDLSTATGVNRALAQVFRMLARGRISRQEAATFTKLGQLLLQSISAMRAERADETVAATCFKRSAADFSAASLSSSESASPGDRSAPSASRMASSETSPAPRSEPMPEPAPRHQTPPAAPPSSNLSVTGEAIAAAPDSEEVQPIESNSRTINTSANRASNSRKINTYEIAQLNPVQNQHLQNKRRACIGEPEAV